jgi:hypothetical protein
MWRCADVKMEPECFSEMSVTIYQSKRRHNSKMLLLMSLMLLTEANRYKFAYRYQILLSTFIQLFYLKIIKVHIVAPAL